MKTAIEKRAAFFEAAHFASGLLLYYIHITVHEKGFVSALFYVTFILQFMKKAVCSVDEISLLLYNNEIK